MTFFTRQEYENKYGQEIEVGLDYLIEMACEMIYSQVGIKYRDPSWSCDACPVAVKNASMEQLRFMMEYEVPFLDNRGEIKAGDMVSDLKTDYSTLALRILANAGLLYRGNLLNTNMGMKIPFGG